MRKQFNLQDWLKDKSQKVETRDGRQVKIISFEMTDTNDCPIAAQFRLCAGTPVVYLFDKEGHYKGEGDSDYDLFIVTSEEELTDFENAFGRAMMEVPEPEEKEEWYQFLKEKAAELLSLAREQLKPDINSMLESNYKTAYKEGYDEGKKDALKDLPKWKECDGYWDGTYVTLKGANPVLIVHGKILSLEDLMKLPGFKED